MKQTAVEWLHEEYMRILKDNYISVLQAFEILDKYNQAKEMEKEQIENIFDDGYAMKYIHGEQYYKKTYEKDA
jgi:hypothetical protein